MADIKLSELLISTPVTEDLTGDEPLETVIGVNSKAYTTKQLSATPINAQTIAAYTLALTDQGKVVTMSNVAASSVTIPPNSTTAFNIGTTILIRRIGGSGAVTISPGAGVSIEKRVSSGFNIAAEFAQVVLHKTAINTWHLAGELLPA